MDYQSKNHVKFLILYHLIFVCKYRKKLLVFYGDKVKQLFEDMATRSDFAFEALEVDQDHIHCLVKSEPRISPLTIVRRLKRESTVQLWQRHEKALEKQFWKERTFWSDGYFCCTIGNASQETIRQYIESQGSGAAFIHEAEDLVVFSPHRNKQWDAPTKVSARPTGVVLTEPTGFEPAIFCVTGRHVRPLHHGS